MTRALLLALLTGCSADVGTDLDPLRPDAVLCGWVLADETTLRELPEGQCWRVVPADSDRATSDTEATACDVEPGVRYYPPGSAMRAWARWGTQGERRSFRIERAGCQ